MLVRTAERFPDKSALIYEDQRIGYRELVEGSERLARRLAATGSTRGGLLFLAPAWRRWAILPRLFCNKL